MKAEIRRKYSNGVKEMNKLLLFNYYVIKKFMNFKYVLKLICDIYEVTVFSKSKLSFFINPN